MPSTSFRFAPEILRRLGEELNPSPSRGIIELVKNAYDADARTCLIDLKEASTPGGCLQITDDGRGMTPEDITDGWFLLGKSRKAALATTELGRIPVGDKGLGRLAALRLGTTVVVRTRPGPNPTVEYEFAINWKRFDQAASVEDIIFDIHERPLNGPIEQGTEISVSALTSAVTRLEARKLARELLLLADPFDDRPTGFSPVLDAPDYRDLQVLVDNRYFQDAAFLLTGEVGADGLATASVFDPNGDTIWAAYHQDVRQKRKTGPYRCPPVTFKLWVYLLNRASFLHRPGSLTAVRDWLGQFGGVHLYQDGIRVAPYGDQGNDWLDMNLIRVRSPELTPGTNTTIGRIDLRDTSDALLQKTDRSGFIENEAFQDLREFAQDCLKWMQRCRIHDRDQKREEARREEDHLRARQRRSMAAEIKRLPAAHHDSLSAAFGKYERLRDREVRRLREDLQLYRTLSTVGIASTVFAHETIRNPLQVISQSAKVIRKHLSSYVDESLIESRFGKPLERIVSQSGALLTFSEFTLSLVQHQKRRQVSVNLHKVIRDSLAQLQPFLEGRHTVAETQLMDGEPHLYGTDAAIEGILTNLVTNSLQALEQSQQRKRKIVVRTTPVSVDRVELRVLDNGPGIHDIGTREIWQPGQTTRAKGTGLGLAIVRDTAMDLSGDYGAVEQGEFGGAEIYVRLVVTRF